MEQIDSPKASWATVSSFSVYAQRKPIDRSLSLESRLRTYYIYIYLSLSLSLSLYLFIS